MTEPDDDTVDLEEKPTGDAEPTPSDGSAAGPKTVSVRAKRSTVVTAAVLAVAFVAAAALSIVLYFTDFRSDSAVDADVQAEVLSAASGGAAAVLSYSPDTLDADFADAKSRLTGDFLSYYDGFTANVVAPAARDNAVKTEATVMGTAVTRLDDGSATVLVFINQSTTSKDTPDPNMTSSSVRLGMERIDGKWLISAFDPV